MLEIDTQERLVRQSQWRILLGLRGHHEFFLYSNLVFKHCSATTIVRFSTIARIVRGHTIVRPRDWSGSRTFHGVTPCPAVFGPPDALRHPVRRTKKCYDFTGDRWRRTWPTVTFGLGGIRFIRADTRTAHNGQSGPVFGGLIRWIPGATGPKK